MPGNGILRFVRGTSFMDLLQRSMGRRRSPEALPRCLLFFGGSAFMGRESVCMHSGWAFVLGIV